MSEIRNAPRGEATTVPRRFVHYGEVYSPPDGGCGPAWVSYAVADDGTAWTRVNSDGWEQVPDLPRREVTP